MMIGDARLLTCPSCGKTKRVMSLLSGNMIRGEVWSDERRIYPYMWSVSPVQRCPHCSYYFCTDKQDDDIYDKEESMDLGKLTLEECQEALVQFTSHNKEYDEQDEICIRRLILHTYNDIYYRSKEATPPTPSESEALLFKNNALSLIELVADNSNFAILSAELYRELGMLDKCITLLSNHQAKNRYEFIFAKHIAAFAKDGKEKVVKMEMKSSDGDDFKCIDITIDDTKDYIESEAYRDCDYIKSITIPKSVKYIGDYAFACCENVTSITIPDSVTYIGMCAFARCPNLTNITIPKSVEYIGDYAFAECGNITSLTIPQTVTNIGKCAFAKCKSLTKLTIQCTITSILKRLHPRLEDNPLRVKKGFLINSETESLIAYIPSVANAAQGREITDVTIPKSVRTIGSGAFKMCDTLTSITIPSSVTIIGKEAFAECRALTSITIPDSVKYINERAFKSCYNLSRFTIPDSVTSINANVFDRYHDIREVVFPKALAHIFADHIKRNEEDVEEEI